MKKNIVKLLETFFVTCVVTVSTGCSDGVNEFSLEKETMDNSYTQEKVVKYLMDTDKRLINEKELEGLDSNQLRLIKNEILARHGFVFSTDKYMKNYFSNMSWYTPNPDFSIPDLEGIEKDNYTFLEEYIKKIENNSEKETEITTVATPAPSKTETIIKYIPSYVQTAPPTSFENNSNSTSGKIYYCCASEFITLRESASTKSNAIDRIYSREAVEYLGSDGAFYYVRYNGKVGYALSKFLSENINAPLLNDPR